MSSRYLDLTRQEIVDLLRTARKNYISCKTNRSQETGLWGQQCLILRKLLTRTKEVLDFRDMISSNKFNL